MYAYTAPCTEFQGPFAQHMACKACIRPTRAVECGIMRGHYMIDQSWVSKQRNLLRQFGVTAQLGPILLQLIVQTEWNV